MAEQHAGPSAAILEQSAQANNSANQSAGSGSMSFDSQLSGLQGGSAQSKGFDNPIIKGAGANIIEDIGTSPLVSATGGNPDAFKGLQTADVAAKISGNQMTAPSLSQGQMGTQSLGQGQG